MASSLKERISSPLEAGTSIVDGHHLPPALTPALEYTSKRLARKALHLTCVVVRRDYQLPSPTLSSPGASGFSSPGSLPQTTSISTSNTPVRPSFTTSPFGALKNLVRSNIIHSDEDSLPHSRAHSLDLQRTNAASPTFSDASLHSGVTTSSASTTSTADSTFTGTRGLAALGTSQTQSPTVPMTPATPFTVDSSTTGTTDAGSAMSASFSQTLHQFGIKLLHAVPPTAREDKGLRHALERAARKFNIGPEWISNPIAPSCCGLTADLMDRSLLQNEVLFTSEGLTLLALDHLYTFKCALQSYAKTQSPCRLEDAVDELRRLVLGNEMRNLRKSILVHNYTWLGRPDNAALQDVGRMYHRAYGNHEADRGIENDMDLPSWPLPDTRISLHDVGLAEELDAGPADLEQHLYKLSFEELAEKPLPKTPVGTQSPVEIDVQRGRSQVRSTTPEQRTPTHSIASRNSGTPGRRKSPPAALHIESSSRAESPLPSGLQTPASTVTEQSDTGRSVVSNLTTQSERAATPQLDQWGEEKEFLGMEVELDMDEIEDWYREVDIDLDTVTFKPARAAVYIPDLTPQVVEIRQAVSKPAPVPLSQPPPQPSATAKVGLMGLRLDTKFTKPKPRAAARRHQISVSMDATVRMTEPHVGGGLCHGPRPTGFVMNLDDLHTGGDGDDTEEELTARPPDSAHPATDGLRGFVRWNSVSIDSVLSPIEGPGDRENRVGPMTPNGYDDISPITRGEWGFLMGADRSNGRQVNVTECL